MPSVVEMLCQITAVKVWYAQIKKGTLFELICYYYAAYHNHEPFFIAKKWDRIYFVKNYIKRKFPRKLMKPRLFFHLVEKHRFFNPFYDEIDTEKYFQIMLQWKEKEMEDFLKEHPFTQRRHKKIWKVKLLR